MMKLRGAALGLFFLLPLAMACDSGTAATAVATVIPTDVAGAALATATALPGALSGAATAAAPTMSSAATAATTALSGAATAVAPTLSSAATAATTALSGAATMAAPTINAASTAAMTALSGAATAATTAVSGSLSAADQAYLTQVQDLATKLQNSQELSDVVKALTTAAATGATGGTVDTAGLTTSLTTASTFVNGIASRANALQPPAGMKPVQDELMKSVTDWQGSLQAAQTAVGAQNWANAAQAGAQMTQGATDVATLIADLAARGMR